MMKEWWSASVLNAVRNELLFTRIEVTVQGMVYARQGKLIRVFLQVPIAQPTDGQVLRFPVGVIAIQVTDGQNMAAYPEAFGPPAMLTAMPSTDFGKFPHFADCSKCY